MTQWSALFLGWRRTDQWCNSVSRITLPTVATLKAAIRALSFSLFISLSLFHFYSFFSLSYPSLVQSYTINVICNPCLGDSTLQGSKLVTKGHENKNHYPIPKVFARRPFFVRTKIWTNPTFFGVPPELSFEIKVSAYSSTPKSISKTLFSFSYFHIKRPLRESQTRTQRNGKRRRTCIKRFG